MLFWLQGMLDPGGLQLSMRIIGMAERALLIMKQRVLYIGESIFADTNSYGFLVMNATFPLGSKQESVW